MLSPIATVSFFEQAAQRVLGPATRVDRCDVAISQQAVDLGLTCARVTHAFETFGEQSGYPSVSFDRIGHEPWARLYANLLGPTPSQPSCRYTVSRDRQLMVDGLGDLHLAAVADVIMRWLHLETVPWFLPVEPIELPRSGAFAFASLPHEHFEPSLSGDVPSVPAVWARLHLMGPGYLRLGLAAQTVHWNHQYQDPRPDDSFSLSADTPLPYRSTALLSADLLC